VTPSRDTIRSNILLALQLTASASMQRDYAARVPIANVPAEVLCGWEDSYWPGDPGFGTPEEGFTLRWVHHAISKDRLGYPETVRLLELQLARCDPSYRPRAAQELELARAGRGPTTFDWLVEIIRDHGPGGRQAEDRVDLVLA